MPCRVHVARGGRDRARVCCFRIGSGAAVKAAIARLVQVTVRHDLPKRSWLGWARGRGGR
eukprot:8825746-Alexandrium_andersonii.AAC.1